MKIPLLVIVDDDPMRELVPSFIEDWNNVSSYGVAGVHPVYDMVSSDVSGFASAGFGIGSSSNVVSSSFDGGSSFSAGGGSCFERGSSS